MVVAVGIDLGGTHLRLASVRPSGELCHFLKVKVGKAQSPSAIVRLLTQSIRWVQRQILSEKKWIVGIGVAGIVSIDQGMVFSSPHFPLWKKFAAAKILRHRLKLPVCVDNDANMIARGELWKGAGRGLDSFLMVTLGTGIGGAIVINKQVFHGSRGFAGEFGHMVLQTEGPRCACGSRGCFEMLASAQALRWMIREAGLTLKVCPEDLPEHLALLARKGNAKARKIYDRFGYYLGIGLASLVNVTGIQNIILGGGLAQAQPFFLKSALQEFRKRTYRETAKESRIKLAQLGDRAGVLGAALMALEKSVR